MGPTARGEMRTRAEVGLEVEEIVGALRLPARDELSADDDAPFVELDLLAGLQSLVPAGTPDGGQNELRAGSRW